MKTNTTSANQTTKLLEATYTESERLIDFLAKVGKPKKRDPGKKTFSLHYLNSLFKEGWETLPKGGHNKFKHLASDVVIEYKAHEDPVDPGAAVSIAQQVQLHINRFYYSILGFSPRHRKKDPQLTIRPQLNFKEIAQKFDEKRQQW